MEWLLLIGLVVVAALLLVSIMTLLRFERAPRRLPTWVPAAGLVVSGLLFAVSIVSGSWPTAIGQGLTMLAFSMLLGMSRRRRD